MAEIYQYFMMGMPIIVGFWVAWKYKSRLWAKKKEKENWVFILLKKSKGRFSVQKAKDEGEGNLTYKGETWNVSRTDPAILEGPKGDKAFYSVTSGQIEPNELVDKKLEDNDILDQNGEPIGNDQEPNTREPIEGTLNSGVLADRPISTNPYTPGFFNKIVNTKFFSGMLSATAETSTMQIVLYIGFGVLIGVLMSAFLKTPGV